MTKIKLNLTGNTIGFGSNYTYLHAIGFAEAFDELHRQAFTRLGHLLFAPCRERERERERSPIMLHIWAAQSRHGCGHRLRIFQLLKWIVILFLQIIFIFRNNYITEI